MRGGLPRPAAPVDAEQGVRWAVGLLVVGALVLGALEGGFAPSRWGPFAVLALWGALACAWKMRLVPPSRAVLVAVGAYAALSAWTLLSVVWADTPGRALEGAGRTILYGVGLTVALLPRWPRTSVRRLLGLLGAGTVLLAIGTVLWVDHSANPSRFFIDGRLASPTGYSNATAGLWAIALFPLVHLAAGGARTAAARVLSLSGAAVLLQVTLLSQSRGALLAIVVTAIVLLTLSPYRGAVLLVLAALLAATAPVAGEILDVRGAPSVAVLAERLDGVTVRIAAAVAVLTLVGAAWQLALRAMPPRLRGLLSWPVVGAGATGALALAALVAVVVAVGNPVSWGADRVDEALSSGYDDVPAAGERLTSSLGSDRGDFYRVALKAFSEHPVTGVGAEDFQPTFLEHRRSGESPRYVHSFPLGVLSGLGLPGLLLALAALGTLVVTALLRMRGLEAPTRAGVAALLAGFVAWLLEASWDWTWEFPALTLVGFVLLAVAARSTEVAGTAATPELRAIRERARAHGLDVPDDGRGAPARPRTREGLAVGGVLVALALAASVAYAAVGASSYLLRRGSASAGTDRAAAARDLGRAADLNPIDGDALLSRAIVVRRAGDAVGWRRDLVEALDRSPKDWLGHLELGMADALQGRRAEAVQNLRRAAELNPQQPLIDDVLAQVRRGEQVVPDAVEIALSQKLRERLSPTQP